MGRRLCMAGIIIIVISVFLLPGPVLAGGRYYTCTIDKVGPKYITSGGVTRLYYYVYVTDIRGSFSNRSFRIGCKEMLATCLAAKTNDMKIMIYVDAARVNSYASLVFLVD